MIQPKILVVDDEKNIRDSLQRLLELDNCQVDAADHGLTAQRLLSDTTYSCILLDLKMPDIDGMSLLRWIGDRGIQSPVIMMSAHGEIRDAVAALQNGARDYLVKPFDIDELQIRMQRVIDAHQLNMKFAAGRSQESSHPLATNPKNPAMKEVIRIIEKSAPTESTILITGESGTGKEVAARYIHQISGRTDSSFVPVNIAGIPEALLESELFGYEKGSFTGADRQTLGIFEAAEGGTVFLDEIGEMSLNLQAKLLRVLQEHKIRRVGAVHELAVNIRVIAATNRDLETLVAQGKFREDLFYRLNVVRIALPALRERQDEIPELIARLSQKISQKMGRPPLELEEDALSALCSYRYPGNIRELENLLERALILSDGPKLSIGDFPGIGGGKSHGYFGNVTGNGRLVNPGVVSELFSGNMKDIEQRIIRYALSEHKGNRSHASQRLGISRKTLISKIKEYEIDIPPR